MMAALPTWLGGILWPSIVALVLIVAAVGTGMIRWWRAFAPFAVGAATQLVGVLLLAIHWITSPWMALWWTLGAGLVTLTVVLTLWIVTTLRARALEKKMLAGIATGPGASQQQIENIRHDMTEALELLRRAGHQRGAIYTLPWFLVLGRPQAGKTVAIKNSGLNLPVRKDWVKGVGGTHTCDWFFTNELIFLDTPGKWVIEGSDRSERQALVELLRLLRRHRRKRPLDGLIVVVPTDDLLGRPSAELTDRATRMREVIDLVHEELGFRLPIYLIVSKSDLVDGFVDFFRGLPAQRRHEIFGYSNPEPSRSDPEGAVAEAMAAVLDGLSVCRAEMLARVASRRQARRLLFFVEEFRRFEEPLAAFAGVLFRADRYREAPLMRGIYFTSGTQGEGSPIGKAMAELSRSLGVPAAPQRPAGEEEQKRSYFLLDLFRKLMVEDRGLLGRTSGHGWRQRRAALLLAFCPAVAGLLLVIFSLLSLALNRGVYERIRTRAPAIVQELKSNSARTGPDGVAAALRLTEELREFDQQLSRFSPWRGFGMRRPGELVSLVGLVDRRQFAAYVLGPVLAGANAGVGAANASCDQRLDVLHAVVQLRLAGASAFGRRGPDLGRFWGVSSEAYRDAGYQLGRQYAAYRDDGSRSGLSPLPGFSIPSAAAAIVSYCSSRGGTSPLLAYLSFQDRCGAKSAPAEIKDCYSDLGAVLRSSTAGGGSSGASSPLADDLKELAREDDSARPVAAAIDQLQSGQKQASDCVGKFADMIPALRAFAAPDGLVDECKDAVKAEKDFGAKAKLRDTKLAEQSKMLEPQEKALKDAMDQFNVACKDASRPLALGPVKRIAEGYRKAACVDLADIGAALAEGFGDGIANRFPFVGERSAQTADLAPLVKMFGGASGQAPAMMKATQGKGLSPAMQSWLNEAMRLSQLLFETDSDTPRQLKLTLTQQETLYEPQDLAKARLVETVKIQFGERELVFGEKEGRTKSVTLDLFGSGAPESAAATLVVLSRKGALGRAFSKADYENPTPVEAAPPAKGPWAPLRLLQSGMKGGSGQVVFAVPVKIDKKKTVTIKVQFSVDAGGTLPQLLSLMRNGFRAPPGN